MDKLQWCCQQKKGIVIIPPNNTLCSEYMKCSDEDLIAMMQQKGKWRNIAAYYSCYESLCAILQKIGIKCEIHECSIALMGNIPGFSLKDKEFILNLKKERIDVQYYLKKPNVINEKRVKEFVLLCKQILSNITEKDKQDIRNMIKKIIG
ncbi:hypothetical protein COV16_02760 [Candidatus Woesearchaeota archaeon CG10_big_fil_rev_8_21_14_0_10_34_8]|nr:MAG: hypothetical protein COV16_02760 [Candidatus Woesearchaeota archaeon CG10_big_fil_rev_8_21_14_0_10_34_8]